MQGAGLSVTTVLWLALWYTRHQARFTSAQVSGEPEEEVTTDLQHCSSCSVQTVGASYKLQTVRVFPLIAGVKWSPWLARGWWLVISVGPHTTQRRPFRGKLGKTNIVPNMIYHCSGGHLVGESKDSDKSLKYL